jgi:hypothetical protein
VNVSSEQQTRIHSVVSKTNIREVSNVNVTNLSVGTTLPATIEYQPIPAQIVEIVPQFRGYRVVKVRGEILVVEPESHRVVYIIR